MAKESSTSTSTNTAFFKTGGRDVKLKEETAHLDEKAPRNQTHGAKMQGKTGQQNFIPGGLPVGQRAPARPTKKKPRS